MSGFSPYIIIDTLKCELQIKSQYALRQIHLQKYRVNKT